MNDYTTYLRALLHDNPHIQLAYIDQQPDAHVLHIHPQPGTADPQPTIRAGQPPFPIQYGEPTFFYILRCPITCPRHSGPSTVCQNEPILLGCQIQPLIGDWVGTAGAPVRWSAAANRSKWGILSNWHVIADGQHLGDPIFQPTRQAADYCAHLDAYHAPDPAHDNVLDVALGDALVEGYHTIADKILSIGKVDPALPPLQPGMQVIKYGRTTELTTGVIQALDAAVRVNYGEWEATFIHQIVVKQTDHPFSAPGDSGSLILTADKNRPAALLFAGGGELTIGNPIPQIMDAFDLSFSI